MLEVISTVQNYVRGNVDSVGWFQKESKDVSMVSETKNI
jgi:hypothetical protein